MRQKGALFAFEHKTQEMTNIHKLPDFQTHWLYCWGFRDLPVIYQLSGKKWPVLDKENFPVLFVFTSLMQQNKNIKMFFFLAQIIFLMHILASKKYPAPNMLLL